jgi:lysozyme
LTNWWSVISKLGSKKSTLTVREVRIRVAIVVAAVLLLLLGIFLYPRIAKGVRYWWKHRNRREIKAFGISVPRNYALHGIDVSKHQGEIEWDLVKKMKAGGIKLRFAFIKATEGVAIKDSEFDTNWAAADEQHIACGAYHFYRTHVFSGTQAAHFIKTVKLKKGDLPPVLDIEDLDGTKPEIMRKGIKNWLEIVEKHYGIAPIIYTNKDFWKQHLRTPDLAKYRLWIAHYNADDLKVDARWLFWQHSDRGAVYGIEEKVDFNVFCCDTTAFKAILIQ